MSHKIIKYDYNEKLYNFLKNCKLCINYKNIKFDFMDHFQFIKLGYAITCDFWYDFFNIWKKLNDIHDIKIREELLTYNYKFKSDIDDEIYDKLLNETRLLSQINNIVDRLSVIRTRELIGILPLHTKIKGDHINNCFCILKILRESIKLNHKNILNVLINNDNIKLLYRIINNNREETHELLDNGLCPFIGYSVKDNKCSDIIKKYCIKKYWLIKKSLNNIFDLNCDILLLINKNIDLIILNIIK